MDQSYTRYTTRMKIGGSVMYHKFYIEHFLPEVHYTV